MQSRDPLLLWNGPLILWNIPVMMGIEPRVSYMLGEHGTLSCTASPPVRYFRSLHTAQSQRHLLHLRSPKISMGNLCFLEQLAYQCLVSQCSIPVKRLHSHGHFCKRKNSVGTRIQFKRFSSLSSWKRAWQHTGTQGAGGVAKHYSRQTLGLPWAFEIPKLTPNGILPSSKTTTTTPTMSHLLISVSQYHFLLTEHSNTQA